MADDMNTSPFSVRLEGETTGNLWFGNFKAKQRLSLRDQLSRDKIRRELLGSMGGNPDDRALSIAIIISELTVRLTDAPDWWKEQAAGLDMEDGNVVSEVYDKAIAIEKDAAEDRKKKAAAAATDLKKDAEEAKASEK